MSGLDRDGCGRLLRAVFGERDVPPPCPECGGPCLVIGGCFRCGAGPFCQVISDDGFCLRCGADQDDPDVQEAGVQRRLRVVRDEEGRL